MNRRDPGRLAVLGRLQILESPADARYDELVASLATSLAVPVCFVNLLDAERDWIKASVGLGRTELPADNSFCEAFFETSVDLVVAEDTAGDPRFWKSPYVLGSPYIRFYVAARLVVDAETVGTICALDFTPRKLLDHQFSEMRAAARRLVDLLVPVRPARADSTPAAADADR